MSMQEHIYLMSEQSPDGLARQLAPLAGLEVGHGTRDDVYLRRAARLGPGRVGGEVYVNDTAEVDWRTNEQRSMIDAFPRIFDVGYRDGDLEAQLAEARLIFAELSGAPMMMALVNGYDFLLAISDPRRGVTMMPEGTTPDEEHRSLWLPHLLAAVD